MSWQPVGSLWARLPRELGDAVRPRIPAIARHCVEGVVAEIGECAEVFSDGDARAAAVELTRRSIERAIDRVGVPELLQNDLLADFREQGRIAFHQGLSREAAQAAFRVSSRVLWRSIAAAGRQLQLSGDVLYGAAECLFGDVVEVTMALTEGYNAAQAEATGPAEQRARLFRLLTSGAGYTQADVGALAVAIGWRLPERVTAVVFGSAPGAPAFPVGLLPMAVPADLVSDAPGALVTCPETELAGLRELPAGWSATVGVPVPPAQAAESFRIARRASGLAQRGMITTVGPVLWCEEHITTLLLLADEFLLDQLAGEALEPLSGLAPRQHEELATTLLTQVQTRGSAPEIARRLAVHPQTVRARLRRLTELFGERLDDPDQRLRIELALRAERLRPADV
ncbi:helix-turn-helix domain-containing protein [Amycolatopsis pittospori]|uniref:helix-turn-helix domain-containing protein n=1 Tax=Amycolatopsis pittospori TaxID=2749434 RepID=UPI0015F116EE|nr:helix-turn-helix domain-containing protein [Amycolatopsis pittospori]